MIKTIKEREQYNAPCCGEHFLAVKRPILSISISGENPGGTGEDFNDPEYE